MTVKGLLTNALKRSLINYLSQKELFKLLKKKEVAIVLPYMDIISTKRKFKLHEAPKLFPLQRQT